MWRIRCVLPLSSFSLLRYHPSTEIAKIKSCRFGRFERTVVCKPAEAVLLLLLLFSALMHIFWQIILTDTWKLFCAHLLRMHNTVYQIYIILKAPNSSSVYSALQLISMIRTIYIRVNIELDATASTGIIWAAYRNCRALNKCGH